MVSNHKTYGQGNSQVKEFQNVLNPSMEESVDINLKKIQKFWELSSPYGVSDYLKRKGVRAHGIRFRENFYGRVAIVPMKNMEGQLRGYQILNADGSKVFAKGIQMKGLFHSLVDLQDNMAIGIAESYVTAATCYELLPMPTVTAFSGDNMEHVAVALRARYPNSPLVIFADNDRHLAENKGLIVAHKALKKAQGNGIILAPQFRKSLETRDYSDWNDLVREVGPSAAFKQMWTELESKPDDRINRFYF
jgi:putative DNA primase/helicase